MKSLYLIITVVFFINIGNARAQVYKMLPDSNAYWVISYSMGPNVDHYDHYKLSPFKDDTLIGIFNYTKVYKGFQNQYVGSYRQTVDGKVFYLSTDSSKEYILYDFSLDIGDTVYNVYAEYIWNTYPILYHGVVIGFDSVETNNVKYNMWTLKSIWNNSSTYAGNQVTRWIEFIGGEGGLLSSHPLGSVSGDESLYCMSYNDTTYYAYDWGIGMCTLNVGIEKKIPHQIIRILPNPTNGIFTLFSSLNVLKVRVYDILGREVFAMPVYGKSVVINLSDYPKSLYFIQALLDDQNIHSAGIIIW